MLPVSFRFERNRPASRHINKFGKKQVPSECPLYPRKQTLLSATKKSAKCQKQTHAVQQFSLLDYPVAQAGMVHDNFPQELAQEIWRNNAAPGRMAGKCRQLAQSVHEEMSADVVPLL
jgi:hypothetical protein